MVEWEGEGRLEERPAECSSVTCQLAATHALWSASWKLGCQSQCPAGRGAEFLLKIFGDVDLTGRC